METSNLETLIDSLESIGLERKYVVIEIDEYNKQADLDFTEEAHDKFCETPELLMSVLQVFCNYRKQDKSIFIRFLIQLPEQ